MPKLLLFAPCERVAIDLQNNPTLISVLQEWTSDAKEPIPANALAVQRWDIFALWYRTEGDEGKEFVQTCELKGPSGQTTLSAQISFRMTELTHRNIVNVMGLPVNPGQYELKLYLAETGAEKERQQVAAFPLLVKLVQ
jgi:hypothetical protein